jgi:hypothetical protein
MWCFLIEQKVRLKMIFLNRNPLDHRKENLYLGTPSEFCISQPKPKGLKRVPSSIYKGVCYRASQTRGNKYEGIIQKEGVIYRKRFPTEIETARWYDIMAQKLYGDIAFKNNV